MDNSSILVDNTQFKIKIAEVIDNSINIMEKGTTTLNKEINKIREEYAGLINKCKINC